MKSKLTKAVLSLALAVSLIALAAPVFASGSARAQTSGLGLRWLGVGGPMTGVKTAADVLGMTLEDLLKAKSEGKTILQIAQEKGLTREELVAKIEETLKAKIEALVSEGKIDQATADKVLANLTQRIDAMLDKVCSCPGCGLQGLKQNQGQKQTTLSGKGAPVGLRQNGTRSALQGTSHQGHADRGQGR